MAEKNGSSIAGRLNRILYVAAGCFILCIAVAIISITLLSSAITNFVDSEYKVATSVSQIMRGNQGMGRNLSQMILSSISGEEDAISTYYAESIEYRTLMEDGLKALSQLKSDAVDHEGVDKAIKMTESLPSINERLHDMCLAGQGTDAPAGWLPVAGWEGEVESTVSCDLSVGCSSGASLEDGGYQAKPAPRSPG